MRFCSAECLTSFQLGAIIGSLQSNATAALSIWQHSDPRSDARTWQEQLWGRVLGARKQTTIGSPGHIAAEPQAQLVADGQIKESAMQDDCVLDGAYVSKDAVCTSLILTLEHLVLHEAVHARW